MDIKYIITVDSHTASQLFWSKKKKKIQFRLYLFPSLVQIENNIITLETIFHTINHSPKTTRRLHRVKTLKLI